MSINFLKNKKGMTLVEVVVSSALFSIIVLFMVIVYSTAFTIILNSAQLKQADKNAAAGISNELAGLLPDSSISTTTHNSSTLTISFSGSTINASGYLVEGTDLKSKSKLYYFMAN